MNNTTTKDIEDTHECNYCDSCQECHICARFYSLEAVYNTGNDKILAGIVDVMDSVCDHCGGIPQADWLPFWTYDEFDTCTCLRCPECGCLQDDHHEPDWSDPRTESKYCAGNLQTCGDCANCGETFLTVPPDICPECHGPVDDRVLAGMKCALCAYVRPA